MKEIQGKSILVRVSATFELARVRVTGFNCRETQHLAFVCLLSLKCHVCVAFVILKMSKITKVTIALFTDPLFSLLSPSSADDKI